MIDRAEASLKLQYVKANRDGSCELRYNLDQKVKKNSFFTRTRVESEIVQKI